MKINLTLIVLMIMVQQAIACSCNYSLEIPKAFAVSNTVIYGEVVELKISKVKDSMNSDSLNLYKQNEELVKYHSDFLESEFLIRLEFKLEFNHN